MTANSDEERHKSKMEKRKAVQDAEVAHELLQRAEGRERDLYATQALRLGVLALRQASGALIQLKAACIRLRIPMMSAGHSD